MSKKKKTIWIEILGIKIKGMQVPNGITCVEYDENGKKVTRVISHEQFQVEFEEKLKNGNTSK